MITDLEKIDKKKYDGLVNRKRIIKTLEDKANITGYRWTRPSKVPKGFTEKRSEKGNFLHYARIERVSIEDVDGKLKQTIRTDYFEADKITPKQAPKTAYGEYHKYLADSYHGRKSRHWQNEYLTLDEIIGVLNAGYAFAPGYFNAAPGESQRSADCCQYRELILLDGDEPIWTPQNPAPTDLEELLHRYPDVVKDFYWVGESISSRSSQKPELRLRLMAVLPFPIYKDEIFLWEVAIDYFVAKYPFIARGPGIDKVRLSFGNARPESENRVLGGRVSTETFKEWKEIAAEKKASAEAAAAEAEHKKNERRVRRDQDNALKVELKKRGHCVETDNSDPIYEFCEIDPASLLEDLGLATRLDGNSWNWHDSSPGRSFELKDGNILRYSNTMQIALPEADGTKPVNAHRYILYYLYELDVSKQEDQYRLRCLLADQGYGRHPNEYHKEKRALTVAGVKARLVSPLELRPPAEPLPEDQVQEILETVEENYPAIHEAFEQKARVVGLSNEAGGGKSQGAISVAVSGRNVAMSLNSTPLAKQIFQRFNNADTDAFLWKSRWFGYSKKVQKGAKRLCEQTRISKFQRGELMCIRPEFCDASQQRGIPARVGVCPGCPMYNACIDKGHLSQTSVAQTSQVLCIAQPKLFIDPQYRGFFNQLSRNQPSDRVCIIDEAKPHDMYIECQLSKTLLQQWVRDWAGEKLGVFAERMLSMLEVHSLPPYKVARLVDTFEDSDLRVMSRQSTRYNVPYERLSRSATDKSTFEKLAHHSVRFENGKFAYVAVDFEAYELLKTKNLLVVPPQEISEKGFLMLTPAQAFALSIYKPNSPEGFNALPRVFESSHWTPFQQLKRFIQRYPRQADAPIWYDNDTLHFVIPPVVHSRVKSLVCMSATLQREAFLRTFDTLPTAFIKTPPTQWKEHKCSYQVRTGAYPRTSLLEYSSDWKVVGLKRTGKQFISLIEAEIERDQEVKHVIITFDEIVKRCWKKLKKKHANLVDMLSFHNMEGLDFTNSGMVFWIIGSPAVAFDVIKRQAKILYGSDAEPLNYERDPETGKWLDKRLQLCWEAEVSARLVQAVGRARLNRLANKVVVFSNVLIPNFTGRSVGFVPEDLEVAGGLENLSEVAEARQKAERENPPQTQSERQIERQAKHEKKKKQKAEVFRLYYEMKRQKSEIHKHVPGVSQRTVYNWLEEEDF